MGKNVEDQLGAVDDAQFHPLGKVARLPRGHVLIEDHEIDIALEASDHEVRQFACADHGSRIDLRARLGHDVNDLDSCGARELPKLVDVHFEGFAVAAGGDRNENGSLASVGVLGGGGAIEFGLEIFDPDAEVEIVVGWVDRLELLDGFAVFVRRSEGSGVGEAWEPVLADGDRNDGVET